MTYRRDFLVRQPPARNAKCVEIGQLRAANAWEYSLRERHAGVTQRGYKASECMHIEGTLSEGAGATGFDRFDEWVEKWAFRPGPNPSKIGGDIGCTGIRSTPYPDGVLFGHEVKQDPDNKPFQLVIPIVTDVRQYKGDPARHMAEYYRLPGWLIGKDLRDIGRYQDWGNDKCWGAYQRETNPFAKVPFDYICATCAYYWECAVQGLNPAVIRP